MTFKAECPVCHQDISVNKDSSLRTHLFDGEVCPGGNPSKGDRSTIEEKARRYLDEGRVRVREVHGGSALVLVQGTRAQPYEVRYTMGSWRCSCDAQVWRCSHVVAAQLVVDTETIHATLADEIDVLLGP